MSVSHEWRDTALLPTKSGGMGWVAGLTFECARCGAKRRIVDGSDVYFDAGGVRVEGVQTCKG